MKDSAIELATDIQKFYDESSTPYFPKEYGDKLSEANALRLRIAGLLASDPEKSALLEPLVERLDFAEANFRANGIIPS